MHYNIADIVMEHSFGLYSCQAFYNYFYLAPVKAIWYYGLILLTQFLNKEGEIK